MLRLAEDLGANWLLDLWEVVPTPDKAVRVRETTVARVLKSHRIRRFDATHVLSELRMPALTVARGTIEAATAHIRVLAEQLRLINRQLAAAERQLDRLCKELAEPAADDENSKAAGQRVEQDDVTILSSLPGVGRIILATLLAEASDALQRRDYRALRNLCGAAPVTRQSGKSRIVLRRRAYNRRLSALRARGHGHARALGTVGDRLLNVACAMLEARTLFDPSVARTKSAC